MTPRKPASGTIPANHSPGFEGALTDNERKIALEVAARETGETHEWLNLVLEAYDAALAEIARLVNPLDYHVLEADDDGWALRHPLRCRQHDLLDCPVHEVATRLASYGPFPPGRHRAELRARSLHLSPETRQ